MRYELSTNEWSVIGPVLPNKPRSVPRVDDRRILSGIFRALRSGALWRDLPESSGPHTTCCYRFVRWRRAGVWNQIMDALPHAYDAALQMLETSVGGSARTVPVSRAIASDTWVVHKAD